MPKRGAAPEMKVAQGREFRTRGYPHLRRLVEWLKEQGCTDVRVICGPKHPKISFVFEGKPRAHTVPGSPRDEGFAFNLTRQFIGRRHGIGRQK